MQEDGGSFEKKKREGENRRSPIWGERAYPSGRQKKRVVEQGKESRNGTKKGGGGREGGDSSGV